MEKQLSEKQDDQALIQEPLLYLTLTLNFSPATPPPLDMENVDGQDGLKDLGDLELLAGQSDNHPGMSKCSGFIGQKHVSDVKNSKIPIDIKKF